ncbi:urea transporter, partial [Escherichia coli]
MGIHRYYYRTMLFLACSFFFATGIASFNMGHPEILYFSAISAALSPFFAWCLRYPDEEINEGIWGYNAVLYGIACGM